MADYKSYIKSARKRLGINTKDFGEKIGVSGRTVEAWEQGRRNPNKSALILIKKLLT